jgi:TrmH family RNA methyltransferase
MKPDEIKKLHQKKFREESGRFLLEGEHLVQELLKAATHDPRLRTSEIYCTQEHAHFTPLLSTHVVSSRHLMQISETRSPQGIVAVVPLLQAPAPLPAERAIYLHEIQDPGNLGTILRTLAWFGRFRCLLGPGSVDVHNGKTVRASMGAIFHVAVECDVPIESLASRFGAIASLELHGEPVTAPAFRQHGCYVFGNEGRGLPREAMARLRTRPFTIAGLGAIDSLNVAAAVTICQYELHRSPAT